MIRDGGEYHDERYEDAPVSAWRRLRNHEYPPPCPIRRFEPVAPWNDLEHVYHEHDGRL